MHNPIEKPHIFSFFGFASTFPALISKPLAIQVNVISWVFNLFCGDCNSNEHKKGNSLNLAKRINGSSNGNKAHPSVGKSILRRKKTQTNPNGVLYCVHKF